jgi:hypothetical protein
LARRLPLYLALSASVLWPGAARSVVISEIHYNARAGEEDLEFLELSNELSTPEDLSQYYFTNGIVFTIPQGTILGPRAQLVICADVDAVKARYGIANAIGNFEGRLDAGGDRITLVNHAGVTVQNVRYRTRGSWPVGPDGTGHTLSLLHPFLDSGEPESWTQSAELGGTPGRSNFATSTPQYEESVLLAGGATWRYRKGTAAFSVPATAWQAPTFDDSSWEQGPSGFGYGDGDDATVLDDMLNAYVTVAIRRKLTLTPAQLAASGDITLAINYDDGFCAFVNGNEVARAGCGNPGESLPWDAVATSAREAGPEDFYVIPRAYLQAGENTIAIVGHNFTAGSSDFSLAPRILQRRLIKSGNPDERLPIRFNELYRGAAPGSGWIELHNDGTAPIDLAGYQLTDLPGRPDPHVLPAGTTIAAGDFLVVDEAPSGLAFSRPEVQLFLLAPDGKCAAAAAFDRAAPPGSVTGDYAEVCFPDGGPLEWVTLTPTRGAPNQVDRETSIIINEIHYHPPEERGGEFIELYNRGGAAVDLSGLHFTKGIDFTIPAGTTLGAGQYLVIAREPALLLQHYGVTALGPYDGQLADDGENVRLADQAGNLVDEVRYQEGGAWSQWADGGGASLERIDPLQDGSVGSAWEASDESSKTAWELLSFRVPNYAVASQSELHVFLVEKGVCRIDDVSITRNAGANLIPNPGFETSTSGWVIQGTHVASRRVTTDRHSGNGCLEIVASSKGDTLVNRIETDTSPAMTAGAYDVAVWVRWVRGGSVIVLHGEFTAGAFGGRPGPATNLSGNSLSAGLRMTIPWNIGTPGAENSARQSLRTQTGSTNLGPVIGDVTHSPLSPTGGQEIKVRARIGDAGGVGSAQVHFRLGDANGAFTTASLRDDGFSGDGKAGDGVFGGAITPQNAGSVVVYFIEATDSAGARRRYPVDAPARTHVLQVQGPVTSTFDTSRVILDAARMAELGSRPLHSNDLLDGSMLFNDEEIYFHVGFRYRGSPWGRPGGNNYRVRFPDDKPFIRGRKAMNLDNSGGGPNEAAAYYLVGRNASPSKPAPAPDYKYTRMQLNAQDRGMHGLLQPVDRLFINEWYGEAETSVLLKAEGRRQFDDSSNWQWDGCSFLFRGEAAADKEHYRSYYIPGIRQSVDDWSAYMALSKTMDRNRTSNAAFDSIIDDFLDVEAFLRVLSPRILQADWDAFCIGNGHNGYLVLDPTDSRWELLPHDMDNVFGDVNASLFPTADPDVARLMTRPSPRRTYFRVLWEATEGNWWSVNSGPYLNAVGQATGIGFGGVVSYLDQKRTSVRSQVQSSVNPAFQIVTSSGNDITTTATAVTLEGDAPITVESIFYGVNSGDLAPLEVTWTAVTRWRATLDLAVADNAFSFLGFDSDGNIVGSDSIGVHTSAHPSGAVVHQLLPASGRAAGGDQIAFIGEGFAPSMRVFFGGIESPQISVPSVDFAQVISPPAPFPPPADGRVDVEVVVGATRTRLPLAFTYTGAGGFLRGDVNTSGLVELSDALAVLVHLFGGRTILCQDAADADDSGTLSLSDAMVILNFLFKGGPPPAAPFPAIGTDATTDSLSCP